MVKLLSLTFKYKNNKQFVFYSITILIKISKKYTTSCLKSIKNNKVDRNLCAYTSRLLRDHNPFYDNNCYEQQFRSPRVSSSIAIIIRGAARKSMIEVRGAARGEGNEVAAVRPLAWCSTGGRMTVGWVRRDGVEERDRANCFNKAAAERRTVVESGN